MDGTILILDGALFKMNKFCTKGRVFVFVVVVASW